MSNLINFDYNGQTIQKRDSDGYINLAQMCQANGKRIDNYFRLKQTKQYIEVLSNSLTYKVVQTEEGMNGGTWGHPSIALNLAQWLSVSFSVAFNEWALCNGFLDFFDSTTHHDSAPKETFGFVYLVKQTANNFYKIGKSKNPYKRKEILQVASPLELIIVERVFSLNCFELERLLHEHYSAYWIRGEWFELSDELIGDFVRVATELDKQQETARLVGEAQ